MKAAFTGIGDTMEGSKDVDITAGG